MSGLGVAALAGCKLAPAAAGRSKRMAITMDDFHLFHEPYGAPYDPLSRDQGILDAFAAHGVKAGGFVTGQFVDNDTGRIVLDRWQSAGHLIGNHSWSHPHASALEATAFCEEISHNDTFLSARPAYARDFRFPFLDEGGTTEKRDDIRKFLNANGYRNAAVTIDSQDWSISDRLEQRIRENPAADLSAFGPFYAAHVVELAEHYHTVAGTMGLDTIRHTLLVHHNILNMLFMDDVLGALAANGWQFDPAADVLADPLFDSQPEELNSGRSLLDVLASERQVAIEAYPVRGYEFAVPAMDVAGL